MSALDDGPGAALRRQRPRRGDAAIGRTRDAFGALDVVLHDAGVPIPAPVLDLDHRDLLAMLRV